MPPGVDDRVKERVSVAKAGEWTDKTELEFSAGKTARLAVQFVDGTAYNQWAPAEEEAARREEDDKDRTALDGREWSTQTPLR